MFRGQAMNRSAYLLCILFLPICAFAQTLTVEDVIENECSFGVREVLPKVSSKDITYLSLLVETAIDRVEATKSLQVNAFTNATNTNFVPQPQIANIAVFDREKAETEISCALKILGLLKAKSIIALQPIINSYYREDYPAEIRAQSFKIALKISKAFSEDLIATVPYQIADFLLSNRKEFAEFANILELGNKIIPYINQLLILEKITPQEVLDIYETSLSKDEYQVQAKKIWSYKKWPDINLREKLFYILSDDIEVLTQTLADEDQLKLIEYSLAKLTEKNIPITAISKESIIRLLENFPISNLEKIFAKTSLFQKLKKSSKLKFFKPDSNLVLETGIKSKGIKSQEVLKQFKKLACNDATYSLLELIVKNYPELIQNVSEFSQNCYQSSKIMKYANMSIKTSLTPVNTFYNNYREAKVKDKPELIKFCALNGNCSVVDYLGEILPLMLNGKDIAKEVSFSLLRDNGIDVISKSRILDFAVDNQEMLGDSFIYVYISGATRSVSSKIDDTLRKLTSCEKVAIASIRSSKNQALVDFALSDEWDSCQDLFSVIPVDKLFGFNFNIQGYRMNKLFSE